MAEPVEALAAVPLFAGLSKRDLRRLAGSMRERTFRAGTDVLSEGEGGVGFFVIAEGEATVSVGGREVRRLHPGDHFGEIALIDEGVRSATLTATTDLVCYGLTLWEFRPLMVENGEICWKILQSVARKLRTAELPV
jgi:CRP-like cAMP-binding protein